MMKAALVVIPMSVVLMAGARSHAQSGDRANRTGAAVALDRSDWPGTIEVLGLPGRLGVFGAAEVLAIDDAGHPVVAMSGLGRGRLIALGHESYLSAALDGGTSDARAGRWVRLLIEQSTGLSSGDLVKPIVVRDVDEIEPGSTRVLMVKAGSIRAEDVERLGQWVEGGGLLVSGVPAWGWLQLNEGRTLSRDFAANRLFARAGIVWVEQAIEADRGAGVRVLRDVVRDHLAEGMNARAVLNAEAMLERLRSGEKIDATEAGAAASMLTAMADALPEDERVLRPRLMELERAERPWKVPSEASPLGESDVLDRVVLQLQLQRMSRQSADEVRAHPAAAHFPGEVDAGAARVTREVALAVGKKGWHSTGLYAAPGEVIEVKVPPALLGLKPSLRVGAHSDDISRHDVWRRAPRVDRQDVIDGTTTRHASAFGGLVYVVLGAPLPEPMSVEISGAVEAPVYFDQPTSGRRTTREAWLQSIRHAPAPWGEVVTDNLIMTMPAGELRGLDDPEALADFYRRMSDLSADFGAIPRDRVKPERFVADVQISAGYMHSGYPIMTHLDAAEDMASPQNLSTRGNWGLFHELGHNHQRPEWTFEGTGEVTNNLWSVFLMEEMTRNDPNRFHPGVNRVRREARKEEYRKAGARFEEWCADPFLALSMYLEIRDAFGWAPFKAVFAEYERLKPEERPGTEQEKRDQWMMRMSRQIGRDLGPFFEAWGVPVSAEARASIEHLPDWIP